MVATRSHNPWAKQERRAAAQLKANAELIDWHPRGVPAGGVSRKGRSTTAEKGYVLVTSKWGGRCLRCKKKIKAGIQVRYWFGTGITCRTCSLDGT